MDRRTFLKTVPAAAVLAGTSQGFSRELEPIILLKPQTEGGKSVLAAWFHNCDKENTAKIFKLRPEQKVLFSQTVGYPA